MNDALSLVQVLRHHRGECIRRNRSRGAASERWIELGSIVELQLRYYRLDLVIEALLVAVHAKLKSNRRA